MSIKRKNILIRIWWSLINPILRKRKSKLEKFIEKGGEYDKSNS
jgi:hypothetical protein